MHANISIHSISQFICYTFYQENLNKIFSNEFKDVFRVKNRHSILIEETIVAEELIRVNCITMPHQRIDHIDVSLILLRLTKKMQTCLFLMHFFVAKEHDALAFGFIKEHVPQSFHVHVSASYKKDYYLEESAKNAIFFAKHVMTIFQYVLKKKHYVELQKKQCLVVIFFKSNGETN